MTRLRAWWRAQPPETRSLVMAVIVCTGCAAAGYWCGYRDGRRG